jgi:Uma2 family endonuclease
MTSEAPVASLGRAMSVTDAPLHRLTYEDVQAMVVAGILRDDERVELIDGVLVDMTPITPLHSDLVGWLADHFVRAIDGTQARVQDLLRVEGGFVVPDLMVIEPPPRGTHPETALLIVEVSVTTLRYDRRKAVRYARAGVDEYWVVDGPGRRLIQHLDPTPDGYERVETHTGDATVTAQAGGAPVALRALFG